MNDIRIFQSEHDDKYYFGVPGWGNFGPYDNYTDASVGMDNFKGMMWDMLQMGKGTKVLSPRQQRITKRW